MDCSSVTVTVLSEIQGNVAWNWSDRQHDRLPSPPGSRPFIWTPVTMSATPAEEIRANSYVGFDTITQQIEHKLLKRGFQFNVIVVGA